MNPIDKDELFGHLSQFLQNKGVELKDGAYTQRIRKGCNVLADTINVSQKVVEKARTEVDRKIEQVRQVIHEKTAPRKSAGKPQPTSTPAPEPQPAPKKATRAKAKAPAKKAAPAPRKTPSKPKAGK